MRRYVLLGLLWALGAFGLIAAPQQAMAACTYGSCAPSNLVVNNLVTQQASTQTASIIADRISQAVNGVGGNTFAAVPGYGKRGSTLVLGNGSDAGDGKAAGSLPHNLGVWTDVSNLWLKDTQAGADYSGQIFTGLAGFDYLFNDRILLGFAAGYEGINLDTGFNSGQLRSNGIATAIYAGLILSDRYNIDFQFGRAGIGYKESHGGISGSFDANRLFMSTNFNAKQAVGNWRFVESFGVFYVDEHQNGYTESNGNAVNSTSVYLGQLRVKGTVGYYMPMSWGSLTPFASARLEFDVTKSAAPVINSLGQTTNTGNFGTTFGLGFTAKTSNSMSTSIEATTTQFRNNFQAYGAKGTLRWNF